MHGKVELAVSRAGHTTREGPMYKSAYKRRCACISICTACTRAKAGFGYSHARCRSCRSFLLACMMTYGVYFRCSEQSCTGTSKLNRLLHKNLFRCCGGATCMCRHYPWPACIVRKAPITRVSSSNRLWGCLQVVRQRCSEISPASTGIVAHGSAWPQVLHATSGKAHTDGEERVVNGD